MTKNVRIFIFVILVSMPLWWGVNIFQGSLENYLYAQISQPFKEGLNSYQKLDSQASEKEAAAKAAKNQVLNYSLDARSVLVVKIDESGRKKILLEEKPDKKLPIASLTKLMTSLVSLEIYDPAQLLYISKEAVKQRGERGDLKIGERLSVKNLLHIALLESSNDAAFALAEGIYSPNKRIGEVNLVELMNKEASFLKMNNTHFFNPTGLDNREETNYSTSRDIIKLVTYILKEKPEIFKISAKRNYLVLTPDGKIHHFIPRNIDELVGEADGLVGGKTGFTDKAGGCIITIFKNEKNEYLINVILGTSTPKERFSETENLLNNLRNNNLW